jgi:hypothetical protein
MRSSNANVSFTILWLVSKWAPQTSKTVLDISTPAKISKACSWLQSNHHGGVVTNVGSVSLEALTLFNCNSSLALTFVVVVAINVEVESFTYHASFGREGGHVEGMTKVITSFAVRVQLYWRIDHFIPNIELGSLLVKLCTKDQVLERILGFVHCCLTIVHLIHSLIFHTSAILLRITSAGLRA